MLILTDVSLEIIWKKVFKTDKSSEDFFLLYDNCASGGQIAGDFQITHTVYTPSYAVWYIFFKRAVHAMLMWFDIEIGLKMVINK